MTLTMTLGAEGIARRIPHAGRMALLDALLTWDDDHIICTATSHTAADHPLRTPHGLLAPCAVEYAAQAMALHGALIAERQDPNAAPRPGFLASVRSVKMHVARLDILPSPLRIEATRSASQGANVLYEFIVRAGDDDQAVVEGRATVVLNTPLLTR